MCGRSLSSFSSSAGPGRASALYLTVVLLIVLFGHSPLVFVESTCVLARSGTQIVVGASAHAGADIDNANMSRPIATSAPRAPILPRDMVPPPVARVAATPPHALRVGPATLQWRDLTPHAKRKDATCSWPAGPPKPQEPPQENHVRQRAGRERDAVVVAHLAGCRRLCPRSMGKRDVCQAGAHRTHGRRDGLHDLGACRASPGGSCARIERS